MAFPISPLNLPSPITPGQVDWRPIQSLGDTIAEYRQKQQIAEVLGQATDANGNLDVERAGAVLARQGLLDQARPLLALAQQKAALGQTAGAHAEQARHNKAMEDLARSQYENPKPTVQSQYNPATGKMEFFETAPGRPVKNLSDLAGPPPAQPPGPQPGSTEPIVPKSVPIESYGAPPSPQSAIPKPVLPENNAAGVPLNEGALQGLPPNRAELIKKVARYEVNPASLSTRGGEREFILGKAAQYDPSFDQKNYAVSVRTLGAFGAGVEGRTVRAVNNLMDHLDVAEGLMKALDNGDMQAFNALKNRFKAAFGYEAPTNVAAMAPIVSGEALKVVAGVGAGGQTERLENALALFGQSKSTPQALAGIGVVKALMAGQLNGLERQYEAGTLRKDFRNRLSPQARALMGEKEGAATPAAPGAGKPVTEAPSGPRKVQSTAEANQVVSTVRARLREMIAAGGDARTLLQQANDHLRSIGAPTISEP